MSDVDKNRESLSEKRSTFKLSPVKISCDNIATRSSPRKSVKDRLGAYKNFI